MPTENWMERETWRLSFKRQKAIAWEKFVIIHFVYGFWPGFQTQNSIS